MQIVRTWRAALVVACLAIAACASATRPAPPANRSTTSAPAVAPTDDGIDLVTLVPRDQVVYRREADGTIRVLEPAGADVYLDGVLYGRVPLVIIAPAPGRHELKIQLAGY